MKRLLYSRKSAPYIFILPFLLTLLIFWAWPIVQAFLMSTQTTTYGDVENVGFDNYARLWNDKVFWKALFNSVRYMVLTLVLLIPVPLLLAFIVNAKIGNERIKRIFKSTMFLPVLTSVVVAGIVFRLVFAESSNAVANQGLSLLGIDPIRWLREDIPGLIVLLALAMWRWTGVNMMYFIAGLQSIPEEYYEAASLDGAGVWQKFWHVTVPNLKPMIVYVTTISVYGGLAMFLESYMLYGGNNSPNNQGLTIIGYLYRKGISENDMGFASAVGVILIAIVLVINLTQLIATGTLRKEQR